MRQSTPVIAFLIASPFELLDLAGPASVFTYPMVKGKPYYSFRILSTSAGDSVTSMGDISISGACKYSDYTGPIDTLIVVGGLGSIVQQPTAERVLSMWYVALIDGRPDCSG